MNQLLDIAKNIYNACIKSWTERDNPLIQGAAVFGLPNQSHLTTKIRSSHETFASLKICSKIKH